MPLTIRVSICTIDESNHLHGGITVDETGQKIIDAAMVLIRDKGYISTTTKDIARSAGVNECTIFRKFRNKKEIVLQGMAQERWKGNVTPDIFENYTWDLSNDLEMFMNTYMDHITSDFVNLSIGLRAPQIYEDTAPLIMKIPQIFITSLIKYFEEMEKRDKIPKGDYECWAMTIFSSTFGYTFLKASFGDELDKNSQNEYIENSVSLFVDGINKI